MTLHSFSIAPLSILGRTRQARRQFSSNPIVSPVKDMSEYQMDLGTGKVELILDKITIPHPPVSVYRPRLLTLLRQSLASGVSTIISGRSGTGKTTLALHFAELCARQVAWYKVDAPDGDMRIFLSYLLASIAEKRAGFGNGALQDLLTNCQLNSADTREIGLLAEACVF